MEWLKVILEQFWEYIKFWATVNQYQEMVLLRFGKFVKVLKPGTYFKIPFIDYAMEAHVKRDTLSIEPICITTIDGKTISIGMMEEHEVFDTHLFLVETNDALTNMKDVCRGEMSDLLEDITWADIKKKTTKNALKKKITEKYEQMGVRILDLKFTNKAETRSFTIASDKGNTVNAI